MAQRGCGPASYIAALLVLVVLLHELVVLLLDTLRILVGWLEQQLLELVEHALPRLRGYLSRLNPRLQVADERRGSGGDRWQLGAVPVRSCRVTRAG